MKQRTASAICFARTVLIAGLLTIVAGLTAQASIIVYDIHNNKGFTATEDQAPYRSFPVSIDAVFDYDPSEKDSAKNVTNFVVSIKSEIPFGLDLINGRFTGASASIDVFNTLSFFPEIGGQDLFIDLAFSPNFNKPGIGETFFRVGAIIAEDDTWDLEPAVGSGGPGDPYAVGFTAASAAPEPSTWAMLLAAFAGAAVWMRARKRSRS
jgi:PEP-CTERM motif-containing protein